MAVLRRLIRDWFDPDDTALALIGGGLATAAFVPRLRWTYLPEVAAVALLLLGVAVALRAVDHWARSERAMRVNAPLPKSRFPAALALIIAVGAIGLIVVILVNGANGANP